MALTNAQYDTIMNEYERTRRAHLRERDERIAQIYQKIPRYRELDESVPDVSVDFGTQMLLGHRDSFAVLSGRLKEISEEKRALLAECGLPEDYLSMQYTCSACHDTGYVGSVRCRCFEEKTRRMLYEQSHLAALFETNNFSLLREDVYEGEDLTLFRGAVDVCKDFIRRFDTENGYGNILFYGTVGSGKSFLSICTAKEILDRGHSVLYFSAVELFARLSDAVFHAESAGERTTLQHDLYDCDLLIIDDLGAETTNAFVSSQLFNLINERDLRRHATIISTNLEPDELRGRYSDRVFSRLLTYYTVCELKSRDVRLMTRLGLPD